MSCVVAPTVPGDNTRKHYDVHTKHVSMMWRKLKPIWITKRDESDGLNPRFRKCLLARTLCICHRYKTSDWYPGVLRVQLKALEDSNT